MTGHPSSRRLGDGYEPHVDAEAGGLIYSLPVDSGFASASFAFEIQPADLDVLLRDDYRRAVLEITAHETLQRSMQRGARKIAQADFDALVAQCLHSPPEVLETFIDAFAVEHHVAVRTFADQIMVRRRKGA